MTRMPRAAAAALVLAAWPIGAGAQAESPLTAVLTRALADMPATTGVYVKHLTTGREAAVRADQAFSPASVIKLAFMVRAYQMADAATLDLGRRVTLTRAHLRHGTGVLQYHEPGLAPTIRDLVTEMIITSDNTATDVVLEAIGGVDATNAWLAGAGYAEIEVFGRPDGYRRALLTLLDPEFATLTAEETTGLLYTMDGNPLAALYGSLFTGPRARWITVVTTPENRRRFAEERDRRTSSDPKVLARPSHAARRRPPARGYRARHGGLPGRLRGDASGAGPSAARGPSPAALPRCAGGAQDRRRRAHRQRRRHRAGAVGTSRGRLLRQRRGRADGSVRRSDWPPGARRRRRPRAVNAAAVAH